jgi:hypothetical protein
MLFADDVALWTSFASGALRQAILSRSRVQAAPRGTKKPGVKPHA